MSGAPARFSQLLHSTFEHAAAPYAVGVTAVIVSAAMLLTKLDEFPPFTDEVVYARWAVRLAESPSADTLWLSTHEDWKAPAFIWILALVHFWLDDSILTGRLITSLSGVLAVALVFQAGIRLIGTWSAAIAAVILAVAPAFVFTSRLALTDALIVMLAALTWALSIPAVRGHTPSALGAGIAVALAAWTKLSGALLIVIPLAGIVLISQAGFRARATLLATCMAPPSVVAVAFLLAPKSAQTLQHAGGFVLTPDQLAAIPLGQWAENLEQMGGWALAYLPAVAIGAAASALVLPFFSRRREDWWLWVVLVFWLGFHILLGETLYSRYLLPALAPLALLAARAIWVVGQALRRADHRQLALTWLVGAPLLVVLSLGIPASLLIITPTRASLPSDDRAQYIEEWPAGFGQTEALQWIADTTAAEPGSAIVLTNHVYGAPRDLAALTFRKRADLSVHVENRIRHPHGGVADDWRNHGVPVYALINGNQDDAATFLRLNPEFKLAASFERPGAKTVVSVLEFRPG